MRKFLNEFTNEVNIAVESEFLSMGSAILENKNGTQYRIATIKLVTEQGEEKTVTAMCYEKNVQKGSFVKGEKYLTTIAPGDERGPIVLLAPLSIGERLAAEDFTFVDVKEAVEVPA
jgi:hypothetical protein